MEHVLVPAYDTLINSPVSPDAITPKKTYLDVKKFIAENIFARVDAKELKPWKRKGPKKKKAECTKYIKLLFIDTIQT